MKPRVRNPIVLIIVALPMTLGLVPRNWLYGMRTPYSMSSDGAWYRQNVIGGIALLLLGRCLARDSNPLSR